MYKVNHAISTNESLLCIGFQLPDFSLSNLIISKEFTKRVYISLAHSSFGKQTSELNSKDLHSSLVQISKEKHFPEAYFQVQADFSNSEFYLKTYLFNFFFFLYLIQFFLFFI